MSGYTPVFDSVYAGTLCGRWPTTPVWVSLLPLCDKHGHIDLSYQTISALTGWPMELLKQGIAELMQSDPESRSSAEEGRRLVLLDPENRAWGWRVVNHGLYREKARKLQYDAERTASGRDAARKKAERESHNVTNPDASRDVPRCPDASRDVPLSDADSDKERERARGAPPPEVLGLDPSAWSRWEAYRREIRKPIKPASLLAAQRKLAGFGREQSAVVEQSIANGWTGLFALKDGPAARRERGLVV